MNKKIIILFVVLAFTGTNTALAHPQHQSQTTTQTNETLTQNTQANTQQQKIDTSSIAVADEDVSELDLGIEKPRILPDSGLYFFKEFGRGLRLFFTFNDEKEAELRLKYANERLIEAKELAKKTNNPKIIEKALEKYEKDKEEVKKRLEKLIKDPKKREKAKRVLEKLADNEIKHQKILEKIEERLPKNIKERIEAKKEKDAKRLADIIATLPPQEVEKILEKAIKNQTGSVFKDLKNLAVLKRVEELAPEQAKDAIQKAEDNIIRQFKNKLSKLPKKERDKIVEYTKKIKGDPTLKALVVEKLLEEDESLPFDLREKIKEAKKETLREIKETISKDPKAKEKILERFKKAELRKIKLLDELAKEYPELKDEIESTKKEALKRIEKRLKNPQTRKRILNEIKGKDDIKYFKILDEIDKTSSTSSDLPEDVIKAIKEGKREIKTNVLKKAQRLSVFSTSTLPMAPVIMPSFLSDDPEDLKAIEEMMKNSSEKERQIFKKLKEIQLERIQKRIERSQDIKEIRNLKSRIEQEEETREIIKSTKPELLQMLKEERSPEKIIEAAKKLVKKAEEKSKELEELIQKAQSLNINQNIILTAKKHLLNAKDRINKARKLIEQEKTKEAFAMLNTSIRFSNNGIRLIKLNIKKLENKNEGDKNKDILKEFPAKKPTTDKKMVCTQQYEPVCGVDGKTYANKCIALFQNGVKIAYKGECKNANQKRIPFFKKDDEMKKQIEIEKEGIEIKAIPLDKE